MLSKKTKELIELAKDPKFISGIYNYCDRWCERCQFTGKCLTYASLEEDMDDPEANDIKNKKFWKKIHDNFAMVREMIEEDAKRLGINLDISDAEMKEIVKKEKIIEEEAENHELSKSADEYTKMVDKWFKDEKKLFEHKRDELINNLELGMEKKTHTEATGINDAIDIIHWYQHQIHVKLMRALIYDDEFEDSEEDKIQNDANGSVKVSLLGQDRSIVAWEKLRTYFPRKTDDILTIQLHLDRLRRKTEKYFPDAKKFVRPGFDE